MQPISKRKKGNDWAASESEGAVVLAVAGGGSCGLLPACGPSRGQVGCVLQRTSSYVVSLSGGAFRTRAPPVGREVSDTPKLRARHQGRCLTRWLV